MEEKGLYVLGREKRTSFGRRGYKLLPNLYRSRKDRLGGEGFGKEVFVFVRRQIIYWHSFFFFRCTIRDY